MAETMKPRGISLAAAFFCVLAAGCASVRGALLLLEMTAVQLLLGLCLSRLLRPLTGRGSGVAMGVFTAALAAVMQMALMAWKPGWWEEMPTVLYYVLAFLSGAMSARSEEWEEHLPKFGWWAGALLLLGGLREWLAAGRLMGVRLLWDGLSKDFGLGGLGLLTAALLLSICGLKQRWSWQYSVRESAQAGGLLFLCTALAGCIAAPLYRLDLPAGIREFLPALLLCLTLLIGRSVSRSASRRDMLADPALAAAGYAALLCLRDVTTVWWSALLIVLGVSLLAGCLVAAFGAAASRLDSPGLPAFWKTSPVLLMTAGMAVYAFAAF